VLGVISTAAVLEVSVDQTEGNPKGCTKIVDVGFVRLVL